MLTHIYHDGMYKYRATSFVTKKHKKAYRQTISFVFQYIFHKNKSYFLVNIEVLNYWAEDTFEDLQFTSGGICPVMIILNDVNLTRPDKHFKK